MDVDPIAELIAATLPDHSWTPAGTGGTIFAYVVPQEPDRAITVSLYAGPEADTRTGWDQPNIQVRCRGSCDPRQARGDAQDVYDLLHGWAGTLSDGTEVVGIIGTQSGPVWLGQDDNHRHEFAVNFRTEGVRNPARPEA